MIFNWLPVFCASCLMATNLSGQTPAPVSFEVASVKPADPSQ